MSKSVYEQVIECAPSRKCEYIELGKDIKRKDICKFKCSICGDEFCDKPDNILNKSRVNSPAHAECRSRKSKNIGELEELVKIHGAKLIEGGNSRTPMMLECILDHTWKITTDNLFNKNKNCGDCVSKDNKYAFIEAHAQRNGLTYVSGNAANLNDDLVFKCIHCDNEYELSANYIAHNKLDACMCKVMGL